MAENEIDSLPPALAILAVADIAAPVDMTVAQAKLAQASALLRELNSVVVAFSGGVDSTLVLKLALEVLGPRAVAVIAVSASLPAGELAAAEAVAGELGTRLIKLETDEVDQADYQANTEAR